MNSPVLGTVRLISPLRFVWDRRNPLRFLDRLGEWPGDLAQAKIGRHTVVLLKHPDLVQKLLVSEAAKTEKGRTLERSLFFLFLGDGLLNSHGEVHRRQRRLVLPAFHRSRLSNYGKIIVSATRQSTITWQDGEVRDLGAELMNLTLTVVGRTLFSSNVDDKAQVITNAFSELTANVSRLAFPGAARLLDSPLPFARRIRRAERTLDETVHAIIRKRRNSGKDTGDLLSMLLLAEDAERPGEQLNDLEVRDQIMTLFFAGHETTANALTWMCWLLALHPTVASALHTEVAEVLGDRDPSIEDLPKLVLTEQIVRETLRLYPPIWAMGRRLLEDLNFGEWMVPRHTLVVASQWKMHRDPRWFTSPDTFQPNRWTPAFRAALPRFAYFPFGGGPRSCIGENFAWAEFTLVLATLAQHWSFEATEKTLAVKPEARITLHPDRPIKLRLRRQT